MFLFTYVGQMMLCILKKMIYFSECGCDLMIKQDAYEYKNYLDQILLPHMSEMFYHYIQKVCAVNKKYIFNDAKSRE